MSPVLQNINPSQLVISLIEKEVLPRLQSAEETHLVVAHKRLQVVTLPPLPGVSTQPDTAQAPLIRKQDVLRDRWHKDALSGFAYVTRGKADLLFSRRVVTCNTGNFVFFLPHTWRNLGVVSHWERPDPMQTECEILWLYLRPQEVLSHVCRSSGTEHFGSRHLFIPDRRLLILAKLLQEEVALESVSRSASQLLWLIYERVHYQLQQGNFLTNSMTTQELTDVGEPIENIGRSAQQYVDANLAERMTLESVARALFTTRTRLAREFPQCTGETFGAYLLRRRLERAQHLLTMTSYSIKEIAWRTGFPDPDYFSSAFRRETGNTPTEFRKKRRYPSA